MYDVSLEIFIQSVDCGSFTKAADKLFLSPTAVMKQMNLLEARLGVTLFKRTNHGISLTPAGESIYKDAKYLIKYSDGAVQRAREIEAAAPFVIRVGTSFLNPCKKLMELWAQVSDSYPQFQIKIVPFEDDHNSIVSTIASLGSSFDFIVGACDSAEWLKRCQFFQLGSYHFCCAVSQKHRLAEKDRLKLTDLYGERLMMVSRGDSPMNDEIRDEIEKEHPQIQIEDTPYFYDLDVFNRCDRTGSVLLTLDGWEQIHPSLKTVPLDWNGIIPYGLLYSRKPSRDVLEFLDAATSLTA